MVDYSNFKRKIDSYLGGNDNRPFIVDVSSLDDLQELSREYLTLGKIDVFNLAVEPEEWPSEGKIYEALDKCILNECLVYNLGAYLRLLGRDDFNRIIHSLLSTSYKTKFVIITYQCSNFFNESDLRCKNKILCLKTEKNADSSSLVFVPAKYQGRFKAVHGLGNALSELDKSNGRKITPLFL